jgi:hypothetical protein
MDRSWFRSNRAFEAAACLIRSTQSVVLLTHQNQQGDIFGRKCFGSRECPFSFRKLQLSRSRDSQFKPQLRYPREALYEITVTGEGRRVPITKHELLSLLPASNLTRIPLQLGQIVRHW